MPHSMFLSSNSSQLTDVTSWVVLPGDSNGGLVNLRMYYLREFHHVLIIWIGVALTHQENVKVSSCLPHPSTTTVKLNVTRSGAGCVSLNATKWECCCTDHCGLNPHAYVELLPSLLGNGRHNYWWPLIVKSLYHHRPCASFVLTILPMKGPMPIQIDIAFCP